MSQVHGRIRLAGAASLLLTTLLVWSASVAAQSPAPTTASPAPSSAVASPAASAAAGATAGPSTTPASSAGPAASTGASWAPPVPAGPVTLLLGDDLGGAAAAFEAVTSESCPGATVDSQTATDAETQAQQLGAALGAAPVVVIIEAVDAANAGALVTQAHAAGAAVIVLGDDIPGVVPVYRVAYDPVLTGEPIADAVVLTAEEAADIEEDATPAPSGTPVEQVVLIGGPEGDAELDAWEAAIREALGTDAIIVQDPAVTALTAIEGKRVIEEVIAAVGADGFGAVIAPDDAVAAGVIAGLQGAGIDPTSRTITGAGGTLPGTQAVVAGTQTITTWSTPAAAAEVAAVLACAVALDLGTPTDLTITPIDSGSGDVPTVILTPILVTVDGSLDGTRSVADTIIAGMAFGADTAAQVCADLAEDCDAAGIVVPAASPAPSIPPSPSISPAPSVGASAAPSPIASGIPADPAESPAAP